MKFLMLDMFRAGICNKPSAKIHYYVMPHTPGNTPASWRRQFYGDLAHRAKVLNLFEYRPVQAAYTENHCSDPAMFQEVRRSLHELGLFEDVVQDGRPIEVDDALVDTGATGLAAPARLIQQLGLVPFRTQTIRTSNGVVTRPVYGTVRLTIQGRDGNFDVTEMPDDCPVLIGQVPLEMLDLVVDSRNRRLIGNPEHGGAYVLDFF